MSFQGNSTTDIPYAKYFEFFPYETWSLDNYVTLILDNYKFGEKLCAHRTFYRTLKGIINNPNTLQEIRDFAKNLVNNKKVCIFRI
jgi:hypothetical protein